MKRRKIPVKIYKTFKDAEREDLLFWLSLAPEERVGTIEVLKEQYYSFKNESPEGFRRVLRVTKSK